MTSLGLGQLRHVNLTVDVEDNPQLPSCQVDSFAASLSPPPFNPTIESGNAGCA